MPKAKSKKPTKVAPDLIAPAPPEAPPPAQEAVATPANPHNLPVMYDKVAILEFSSTSKHGPLTVEDAVTLMGWETEKDYQKRMVEENPGSKPEHWLFGESVTGKDGITRPVHCLDSDSQKVVCWKNAGNRPFDREWCDDLVHTILCGQWAGPLHMPGETINGETIRISRYGRMLSGQHQCTALKLAAEWLLKQRNQDGDPANPKFPAWVGHKEPVLETIVITGLSEDQRVLNSIDYVKPRSVADLLYTMDLYRDNNPVQRKELTRMLSGAIDLLWVRTDTQGYKTHPEIVGFLERHKRLLKCVAHIFEENKPGTTQGRRINNLRLNAGQCATVCYLQACGTEKTTDYADEYRNESPPSEKGLDWGYWDRAQDFWSLLAGSNDFLPVRLALGRLKDSSTDKDDNLGLGGRLPEKLAVLAKAWERYKDHPTSGGVPFDQADLNDGGLLDLTYSDLDDKGNQLPNGQVKLVDIADFGGIDSGTGGTGRGKMDVSIRKGTPLPPPPTREEIERLSQEALQRRGALEAAKNKK